MKDWAELATGKSGWKEIEEAWLRKAQEVYEIFCAKQADYGPTNIGVGGEKGITVRLGDKISRLFELMGLTQRRNGGEAANEPVRDTWIDVADYGIIGLIVHDGNWPLVQPDEVWGKEMVIREAIRVVKDDPRMFEFLLANLAVMNIAIRIADDLGGEVILD